MSKQELPIVLVLMGGPDAEREVSLLSGSRVAAGLRESGRFRVNEQVIDRLTAESLRQLEGDFIAPILHGPWGEGGALQDLLEADGRPYLGAGPAAARLAMDKVASKQLARQLGIPTPDWQVFVQGAAVTVAPPVVVKPVDDGSSVDLAMCHSLAEASAAAERVAAKRGRALVERMVRGREITVGIVAGQALPLLEIVPADGVYDYAAKYTRDDTVYRVSPSDLPATASAQASRDALAFCTAIDCTDLARVDFLVEGDTAWFLEVNTIPGMTDHSLVPKAAAAIGVGFPALCASLMDGVARRARTPEFCVQTAR